MVAVSIDTRRLCKIIVTLAVAWVLAVVPGPSMAVHDAMALAAAESARHAALAAGEAEDHGHIHDPDGAGDHAGHLHGHDPTDHSHQPTFFASRAHQLPLRLARRWLEIPCALPDPDTAFGIDRPPKRPLSA